MNYLQFGMPTLIEYSSLLENAKLCRELGLDFIELNMNLPQFQVEVLEQTENFQKIAEEYGIYFTIHLDENLNFCDFNREVANAYLSTVRRAIVAAKRLRVPVLNLHMNHGVSFTLPDRKVSLFETYIENYMEDIKRFRELCEFAVDGTNIKISIENTDGYREYEKAAINFLLESDVFTLTWDIGHSHVYQNIDEPFILAHMERIRHFHLHDADGGKNHLTLGTGKVDLQKYLSIANQCKTRGVIETKTINSLKQSVQWLESNIQ